MTRPQWSCPTHIILFITVHLLLFAFLYQRKYFNNYENNNNKMIVHNINTYNDNNNNNNSNNNNSNNNNYNNNNSANLTIPSPSTVNIVTQTFVSVGLRALSHLGGSGMKGEPVLLAVLNTTRALSVLYVYINFIYSFIRSFIYLFYYFIFSPALLPFLLSLFPLLFFFFINLSFNIGGTCIQYPVRLRHCYVKNQNLSHSYVMLLTPCKKWACRKNIHGPWLK